MAKTGQNIIILRKKAGLSVRDLQDAFGFGTPQAIYKWQQGLALPTIDNLVALATLLGVTIDDIIVYKAVANDTCENHYWFVYNDKTYYFSTWGAFDNIDSIAIKLITSIKLIENN